MVSRAGRVRHWGSRFIGVSGSFPTQPLAGFRAQPYSAGPSNCRIGTEVPDSD